MCRSLMNYNKGCKKNCDTVYQDKRRKDFSENQEKIAIPL